jgi:dolichyl-phosphate-mannose-protein mannosyltransferase
MLRGLRPDASESPGSARALARAESWQRILAVAAGAVAVALLAYRCFAAADIAFLTGGGWRTNERPVDAKVQQWGQEHVPVATFVARADLGADPTPAVLRVAAARAYRVRVNGAQVFASPDPDADWRRERPIDVSAALRDGANEIAIDVWNPRGPPLLCAALARGGRALLDPDAWTVSVDGGPPGPVVAPDDTRLHPSHAAGPSAAKAFRARGVLVAGLFALAGLAVVLGAGRLARSLDRLPVYALVLVHALWLALFAAKLAALPITTGFDAQHHLAYVEWLRREHALPLPTDGWSMYHPPLYYAAVALCQAVAQGPVATKLPSFAAGLGLVWATFALARVVLAARPALVAAAVLFAGLLPLDVYTAAYVSNEPLHGALFGLSLWFAARTLAAPRVRVADAALVGVAVGMALLAKVTALVVVATAGFFLAARVVQREGFAAGRLAAVTGAYTGAIVAVSGWFYARNVVHYGTPIVGNWNLLGAPWWSQPGFHTPAYYLGFGESLRRPVLAGFHSFADALYASFWGDGWIAGRASAAFPTETWNWDFAAIGYWLALPATAALFAGLASMLRRAFDPRECGRRAVWSFLLATTGALATALVALTLDLPYFGQAKAPYVLGLVPVLAVAFALGADAADRTLARRGGPLAAQLGRTFWIATAAVLWLSMAA